MILVLKERVKVTWVLLFHTSLKNGLNQPNVVSIYPRNVKSWFVGFREVLNCELVRLGDQLANQLGRAGKPTKPD